MRIVLCGNIAFYDDMVETKSILERDGHTVALPANEISDSEGRLMSITEYYHLRKTCDELWIGARKGELLQAHFARIKEADAILVYNPDHHGVPNNIDAETLLSMAVAFFLGKRIYLYNPIPETECRDEVLGMQPRVINGDLGAIE